MKIFYLFVSVMLVCGTAAVKAQNCPAITSYNLVTVTNDGSNNCTYRVDFTMTVNGSNKSVQVVVTCGGATVLSECIVVNSSQNGVTLSSSTFACACSSAKTLVLNSFTSGSCGGASCTTTGNLLPVIFERASINYFNQNACAEWVVSNAAGISYFETEISNGGSIFTGAGRTSPASATAGGGYSHCFTVTGAENFVRIKAVSASEKLSYSPVMKIRTANGGSGALLQSNPVQHTLDFKAGIPAGGNYSISGAGGAIMMHGFVQGRSITVAQLPEGVYTVQYSKGPQQWRQLFVKR